MLGKYQKLILLSSLVFYYNLVHGKNETMRPSKMYKLEDFVLNGVLYLPISDSNVKAVPLIESNDELIDLEKCSNSRIRPMYEINHNVKKAYVGCSMIRNGVYLCLLKMLEILPKNIGIAFQEAWRPLKIQKQYFDEQLIKQYRKLLNWENAYDEASKYVSPFIENTPTHCTGAAIDMSLFEIKEDGNCVLMDLGFFDIISGDNIHPNTFSENVTEDQMKNRVLLLSAAVKAGLVNYGFEWWHFSYGDKAWAYVTKAKTAIYGLKSDDEEILKITKEEYLESFKANRKK